MKTRKSILSRAFTRNPHPRFGFLTAFKYFILQSLENPRVMTGEIKPGTVEQLWAIAVLPEDDPALHSALEDGGEALKEVWMKHYHPSEMLPVLKWLEDELEGVDAAVTEEKPDPKAKKPAPTDEE